ncbi:MAG: LCP family protein [Nostocoides sp.]
MGAVERRSLVRVVIGGFGVLALAGCASPKPTNTTTPTTTVPVAPVPSTRATSSAPTRATPLTVLLIGSDARDGLAGERADVILLAQLAADHRRVNLVSVPRDCYVTLPDGTSGKINAAYAQAGAAGLASTVSQLLGGLRVDGTVEVGFSSFVRVVDELGGVTVTNRHASTSGSSTFPAGAITLNGDEALIYARERKDLPNGDLDRTERHRALMIGLLAQVKRHVQRDPQAALALVASLQEAVTVSGIDLARVLALVPLARDVSSQDITSVMVPIAAFDAIDQAAVDLVDSAQAAQLGRALTTGDLGAYVARYGTRVGLTG